MSADDPRTRALEAAAARAAAPSTEAAPSSALDSFSRSLVDFNPSASDKLLFHRLLDTELLPKCSIPQRVKTLTILLQLTGNILDPPSPNSSAKYRTIRLSNAGIVKNVMDVPGAFDYLVACGFRKSIDDFVPYLNFSPAPSAKLLHSLRVGHHVLKHVVEKANAAAERSQKFRDEEKEEESKRVGRALLGFEEDRRLKREKDDRDKIVRDSRAAAAAADPLAFIPPPYTTLPTRFPGAMDEDEDEDEDGDIDRRGDMSPEEDFNGDQNAIDQHHLPMDSLSGRPPTMTGSSRILGTGAAVIAPPERHGAGPGGRGQRGNGRGGRKRDYDADEPEDGDL